MRNHRFMSLYAGALALLLALPAAAQVLLPAEISEPLPRLLQQKYFEQLRQAGDEIRAHRFPYPFYCSRALDVSQEQQRALDQRSMRFDRYNGQVVLEITGNYFASYSAEVMDRNRRLRQTFTDVMLPLLKAVAPRFEKVDSLQSYALEISHHVRHKVLGVDSENAENVVLIIPREAATRLVKAATVEQQQAAILDGMFYIDAEPFQMWLTGDPPPGANPPRKPVKPAGRGNTTEVASLQPTVPANEVIAPTVNSKLLGMDTPALLAPKPRRAVTPEVLGSLQVEYQDTIGRLVHELDSRAHFVSYAPPSFIEFHKGAYLQFSLSTPLEAAAAGSRFRLASLAFDEHVAHLVRPVLAYFGEDPDFDGVDFSTSVQLPGASGKLAVEYIFPVKALRCYAQYDCTGQQLINAGYVLVNGDRIGLELEKAEAEK